MSCSKNLMTSLILQLSPKRVPTIFSSDTLEISVDYSSIVLTSSSFLLLSRCSNCNLSIVTCNNLIFSSAINSPVGAAAASELREALKILKFYSFSLCSFSIFSIQFSREFFHVFSLNYCSLVTLICSRSSLFYAFSFSFAAIHSFMPNL